MNLTESYRNVLPPAVIKRYDWCETRCAAAVFQNTNAREFDDLVAALRGFRLDHQDILKAGGSKSTIARRLDQEFRELGWREGRYDARLSSELRLMPYRKSGEKHARVTNTDTHSKGYKVDNVKGGVALDVEWHAKDGNLDRDLAAYRSLYDAGIISVGVVITRAHVNIRALALKLGRDGFKTTTTTNLEKLLPRLTRGDAGGCPILGIAITDRCLRQPHGRRRSSPTR